MAASRTAGVLEPASHQAWATQLVNYVSALKNTCGIPVYAIAALNEPDFPRLLFTPRTHWHTNNRSSEGSIPDGTSVLLSDRCLLLQIIQIPSVERRSGQETGRCVVCVAGFLGTPPLMKAQGAISWKDSSPWRCLPSKCLTRKKRPLRRSIIRIDRVLIEASWFSLTIQDSTMEASRCRIQVEKSCRGQRLAQRMALLNRWSLPLDE